MKEMTQDILISNEIRYMIDTSQLNENEKLPSERELAELFHVQRQTIRSALKHLLKEGWIIAKQRSGYYVSKKRIIRSISKLESTSDVVKSMGKDMSLKVISFKIIEANKKMVRKARVPIGTKLYEFIRLRVIEGEPVSIESAYIECDYVPDMIHKDLEANTLFEVLRKDYGIVFTQSQQEILVVEATKTESELLHVDFHSPLVMQRGIVFDHDRKYKSYHEAIMLMNRFVYANEV